MDALVHAHGCLSTLVKIYAASIYALIYINSCSLDPIVASTSRHSYQSIPTSLFVDRFNAYVLL